MNAGTGTSAKFSGMTIAGKTGTTNDSRVRYFVGYTPYYCAAVWTGYPSTNEKISASGNPAIRMWKPIMQKIHENLENKSFPTPSSGLETVTVCADSGKRCTDACLSDIRGSRPLPSRWRQAPLPRKAATSTFLWTTAPRASALLPTAALPNM